MSTLPPLTGHEAMRAAIGSPAVRGELPGSVLVHGPPGVGKQRFALWLGQLLLCERPDGAEPCRSCSACRLCARLEHPDLHWFFPLPRPKGASGPDKLANALEDARATELAARRDDPVRPTAPGEAVGLFLAQIQTVRRLSSKRPALGRRAVFIIGDAEYLVPQESSPEAANALLKVLEEPPAQTTFILTASDPDALLPTLRSRLLPVRLRPLDEELVVDFLTSHADASEADARNAARLAQGSIGRALAYLPDGSDPGPLEELRRQARDFLTAAAAPERGARLAAAHGVSPAGARGAFSDTLEHLTLWLRDLAAVANGAEELCVNADSIAHLQDLARRLPGARTRVPDAIQAVDEARALAYGNVNPQLTLHHLLQTLHRVLADRTGNVRR